VDPFTVLGAVNCVEAGFEWSDTSVRLVEISLTVAVGPVVLDISLIQSRILFRELLLRGVPWIDGEYFEAARAGMMVDAPLDEARLTKLLALVALVTNVFATFTSCSDSCCKDVSGSR
jgi:hypothetical protein